MQDEDIDEAVTPVKTPVKGGKKPFGHHGGKTGLPFCTMDGMGQVSTGLLLIIRPMILRACRCLGKPLPGSTPQWPMTLSASTSWNVTQYSSVQNWPQTPSWDFKQIWHQPSYQLDKAVLCF